VTVEKFENEWMGAETETLSIEGATVREEEEEKLLDEGL